VMLPSGTRLGPYEIVRSLGAGGMGEVYRARDRKLSRDVAIKMLPEIFAHDPERGHASSARPRCWLRSIIRTSARFTDSKKVRLRAAATLVLLSSSSSRRDTRRPRGQGPDPARRDTVNGVSLSPTITTPAATAMGVIMGTAAYMSPDQARRQACGQASRSMGVRMRVVRNAVGQARVRELRGQRHARLHPDEGAGVERLAANDAVRYSNVAAAMSREGSHAASGRCVGRASRDRGCARPPFYASCGAS
jgi:serine/threonine protein kinase